MKLPARTGVEWLKQGFGLFRTQPGVLMLLLVSNLMFSLAITSVPLVGPLIAMVLIPSFSMALLQACQQIDHGQRATLPVLLTGFRRPAVVSLCKLGLVYLALSLVLTLLIRTVVDPQALRALTGNIDPRNPPVLAGGDVLALMGIFLLQGVGLILLSFSAPLAFWQKMAPFKATFYSVFAVLGAKGAFAAMLMVWFGLFFFASMMAAAIVGGSSVARVLIVWIGLLFVLVLQCAIYCAYRQIFGAPDSAPAPAAPQPLP